MYKSIQRLPVKYKDTRNLVQLYLLKSSSENLQASVKFLHFSGKLFERTPASSCFRIFPLLIH